MTGNPESGELDRLEQAVARLPRLRREIFLAHRLDGLSYQEIAALTGLSTRKVERHIARALAAIDRRLCGERSRWWGTWF